MGLVISKPPPGSDAAADALLARILAAPPPACAPLVAPGVVLTRAAPHPVYGLGLQDIIAGAGTEKAGIAAWRYLLWDRASRRCLAEVEVLVDPTGAVKSASVEVSAFVSGAERAIQLAEKLPEIQAEDHELRVLCISALYVQALWLVSPRRELIVPLDPRPPYLTADRYAPADFFAALRGPAQTRLVSGTSPP